MYYDLAYLVGVNTTAHTPNGSLAIRSTIGKAKAKVFPLPVLAPPIQSLPLMIALTQADWISVGRVILILAKAEISGADRPSDSNVVEGAGLGSDEKGDVRDLVGGTAEEALEMLTRDKGVLVGAGGGDCRGDDGPASESDSTSMLPDPLAGRDRSRSRVSSSLPSSSLS
jgi:hypothetical protein